VNAQERLVAQVQRTLLARRLYNAEVARQAYNAPLWAESCWTINGDASQPYRLTNYPFLREIGLQRAREVTVMSGAGTGKTEFFFPWALAHAAWGYPFIYGLETDSKTALLVQERVNPNFNNNPFFKAINKGEADNIKLKKLGRAHGYFLGMGTEAVGYSYHAKAVVFDELDRMDPRIVALVRKRLATAGQPIERYLSNPSVPDFGIDARWQLSDQRRWHVACPHCSKRAVLDWDTHIHKQPAHGQTTLSCPKCKKAFERWPAVLAGWWEPPTPRASTQATTCTAS
jgi:phage terminase large subunit GpA-like protein